MIRRNLSGTDKSLLIAAWYLQREGLKVLVATRDRELMETCWELGIEAAFPRGWRKTCWRWGRIWSKVEEEIWSEEEKESTVKEGGP